MNKIIEKLVVPLMTDTGRLLHDEIKKLEGDLPYKLISMAMDWTGLHEVHSCHSISRLGNRADRYVIQQDLIDNAARALSSRAIVMIATGWKDPDEEAKKDACVGMMNTISGAGPAIFKTSDRYNTSWDTGAMAQQAGDTCEGIDVMQTFKVPLYTSDTSLPEKDPDGLL